MIGSPLQLALGRGLAIRASGSDCWLAFLNVLVESATLTVPVASTRHHGILFIGTPFAWGRNLRTGEPVDIRLKGQRRPADV